MRRVPPKMRSQIGRRREGLGEDSSMENFPGKEWTFRAVMSDSKFEVGSAMP